MRPFIIILILMVISLSIPLAIFYKMKKEDRKRLDRKENYENNNKCHSNN